MKLRLYQVDAFTEVPFAGNPAAVAVMEAPIGEASMQAVAAEMNLSETAFVSPEPDGPFRLRWFTPVAEVDLCGHATLAAAHVMWQEGVVPASGGIRFETLSGTLGAHRADGLIKLDFPSEPPELRQPPRALRDLFPMGFTGAGRNRLDFMVVLSDEAQVRTWKPDLGAVERLGSRGLIVTGPSSGRRYDFVSRYFAPKYGVPEDPVTGSAHCCLGPYWAEQLGRNDLVAYQASARGGVVHVAVRGERVSIGGHAVTVATIDLHADLA